MQKQKTEGFELRNFACIAQKGIVAHSSVAIGLQKETTRQVIIVNTLVRPANKY